MLVMTYEKPEGHPKHGLCTMRIWREVDAEEVALLYMAVEPHMKLQPGDVIQYLDADGNVLGEERKS